MKTSHSSIQSDNSEQRYFKLYLLELSKAPRNSKINIIGYSPILWESILISVFVFKALENVFHVLIPFQCQISHKILS